MLFSLSTTHHHITGSGLKMQHQDSILVSKLSNSFFIDILVLYVVARICDVIIHHYYYYYYYNVVETGKRY